MKHYLRILSKIGAMTLVLSLFGTSVAFAGDDVDGTGESGTEVSEESDEKVKDNTKPDIPDVLAEAVSSYKAALREWRHCIIGMVSGDGTSEDCGSAPDPADHGLSDEDLLSYELDERLLNRVERKLTRVEIKNACIEAHAADGRMAVWECVFEALGDELGDKAAMRFCKRAEFRSANAALTGAEDGKESRATVCDNQGERITDRVRPRGGETTDGESGDRGFRDRGDKRGGADA